MKSRAYTKIRYFFPFIIMFFVSGCSFSKGYRIDADNFIYDTSHKNSNKSIFVVTQAHKNNLWFTQNRESSYIESLENMPEISGCFHEIKFSPGDNYLAVVSSEEGHPFLWGFKTDEVLFYKGEAGKTKPALKINPYPGSLWIKKWETEKRLVIISNVSIDKDMDHREKELNSPHSEINEFIVDFSNGKLKRIKK